MATKELIIVAGPNGAGKSTFVAGFLADRPCPYLSADLIATEFADLDLLSQQFAAGREFLNRLEKQLATDESFVVESTMSGRTFRHSVERAKAAGFTITIVFVYLNSPDTCVARVKARVRRGGHDVSEEDIRRRFSRSFANFWHIYRQIADYWYVVYNSGEEFKRIASGEIDAMFIRDEGMFRQFLSIAGSTNVEDDN